MSKGRVFVIRVVVAYNHIVAVVVARARSSLGTFVKFWRRFHVGLLDVGAGGRGRLVDTEGKLHPLDGSGFRVLTGFTAALLLDRALS